MRRVECIVRRRDAFYVSWVEPLPMLASGDKRSTTAVREQPTTSSRVGEIPAKDIGRHRKI